MKLRVLARSTPVGQRSFRAATVVPWPHRAPRRAPAREEQASQQLAQFPISARFNAAICRSIPALFTQMLLQKSFDHAQRGRQLLESPTEASVMYAALETRMAIEELFYALLPYYREELPSDITKRWQPKQVMEAILECNPMAEQYQQVTLSSSEGQPLFVGQYTPANRELLKEHYHKIASYLHAPNNGKERNVAKISAAVADALTEVERHCRETTVIHNGSMYVSHQCVCGRLIKRNFMAVGFRPVVRCPDERCHAVFDVKLIQGGAIWTLHQTDFKCSKCRVKTPVGSHTQRPGGRFECIGCGTVYVIRIGPIAVPIGTSSTETA